MTTTVVNEEYEPTGETVDVIKINVEDRQIVLDDGTIHPIVSFHEEDGEETDDLEFAVFATAQLSNGRWVPILLSDYEDQPKRLH